MRFIDLAQTAVDAGVLPDRIRDLPVRRMLQRVGEDYGEDRIPNIRALWQQLDSEFASLPQEHADAG
jgi:hypothetical protein